MMVDPRVEETNRWYREIPELRYGQAEYYRENMELAGGIMPDYEKRFQASRQKKAFRVMVASGSGFVPELRKQFNAVKNQRGYPEANQTLVDFRATAEKLKLRRRHDLNLAADDDEINDFCEAKARQCARLLAEPDGPAKVLQLLTQYGVELKKRQRESLAAGEEGMLERVKCEKYWRRKIKPLCYRVVEQIWRELGHTRRGRGCYVSDFTLGRWLDRERKNRSLLEELEAVNDQGQAYSVAELADLGISNPTLRRGELMARMRGFGEWAERDAREWVPMFYTITCPSKYHIYSGEKRNAKFNGATPRGAQNYLCNVWARVRAKADRQDIGYFGFRVAEPHHDGTPHWHLLLFVEAEKHGAFTEIFKAGALAEDGNERGAGEHRFESVVITPERGTAAGYVAKYVSKNIDGFAVGEDWEAQGDAVENAARVRAWASCWGIRQFQQIGGPPVTAYRELRRLARMPERIPGRAPEQLRLLLDTSDAGDWAGYCDAQGGAVGRRASWAAGIWYLVKDKLSQYGEQVSYVGGLRFKPSIFFAPIKTRVREWVINFKARGLRIFNGAGGGKGRPDGFLSFSDAIASPWTCVNNCTGQEWAEYEKMAAGYG